MAHNLDRADGYCYAHGAYCGLTAEQVEDMRRADDDAVRLAYRPGR